MPHSASHPSLSRQLFAMTWPMLFGVLSLMSFQLVDSAFIGQLGVLPLAAQGFTLPMQMVIIGIQVGLGIATTSVISRALGAERSLYARQLGGLIVLLGGSSVALLDIIIYLLRYPILELLSAPISVYTIIDQYWPWWLASTWCGAILYFFYSLCRANGNTMLPGIMMMVTSVLNLILDPLFIFYFDLGINGAAIATILAFGIGILIVAPKVITRQWLTFNWHSISIPESILSILHIMGPAMISQLLPSISAMLATRVVAGFGAPAIAAWAVGSRFEFFCIVAVLALTMSMPPMLGRLLGAGKFDDIQQLVNIAVKFILLFQTSIAIISFFSATPLAQLMTNAEDVTSILTIHLSILPFSLASLGICMLLVSVANALGKAYYALAISALRLFAFFLPLLWTGAALAKLPGLFWGAAIGNQLSGIAAWLIYQSILKKLIIEQHIEKKGSRN
jgi:putative MATE family efflux protein